MSKNFTDREIELMDLSALTATITFNLAYLNIYEDQFKNKEFVKQFKEKLIELQNFGHTEANRLKDEA